VQVELELKRILHSETFAGGKYVAAEKTGQLLSHIVLGTLDGISLTQNAILMDFFGYSPEELDADRDDARIGILRLRKKLAEYNAGIGAHDPVIIEIPKGQYKASFTENPGSPAQKLVTLGFLQLDKETAPHILHALEYFQKAIKLRPGLANAWAGLASTYLTLLHDTILRNLDDAFSLAKDAAEKAVTLDDLCWRAHVCLGSIFLYRHEWEKADIEFNKARRIAPFEIMEVAEFATYLLSRGRLDEARELAQHLREEGFDSAVLMTRAGLLFYVLRDFDAAKETLLQARNLDHHFWRVHLVLSFVHFSLGEPRSAVKAINEAQRFAFWDERSNIDQAKNFESSRPWGGMKIMCLEAACESEKAEAIFDDLSDFGNLHYMSPTEIGLGYLGLGDVDKAISCLSDCCDMYEPFAALLHLWPFLDPLRRHRAFRELLRKWDFPSV